MEELYRVFGFVWYGAKIIVDYMATAIENGVKDISSLEVAPGKEAIGKALYELLLVFSSIDIKKEVL